MPIKLSCAKPKHDDALLSSLAGEGEGVEVSVQSVYPHPVLPCKRGRDVVTLCLRCTVCCATTQRGELFAEQLCILRKLNFRYSNTR